MSVARPPYAGLNESVLASGLSGSWRVQGWRRSVWMRRRSAAFTTSCTTPSCRNPTAGTSLPTHHPAQPPPMCRWKSEGDVVLNGQARAPRRCARPSRGKDRSCALSDRQARRRFQDPPSSNTMMDLAAALAAAVCACDVCMTALPTTSVVCWIPCRIVSALTLSGNHSNTSRECCCC